MGLMESVPALPALRGRPGVVGLAVGIGVVCAAAVLGLVSFAASFSTAALLAMAALGGWFMVWLVDRALHLSRNIWAPSRLFPLVFAGFTILGSLSVIRPIGAGASVDLLRPIPASQWGLYAVALGGFLFGCMLSAVMKQPRESSAEAPVAAGVNAFALMRWAWFCYLVGVTAFFVMVHRGGIPILEHNINAARTIATGSGFISTPLTTGFYMAIFLSFIAGRTLPRCRRAAWFLSLTSLLLLATSGNRGYILVPLATVFLAVASDGRRRVSVSWLYPLALAAFCFLGYTAYARYTHEFGLAYKNMLVSWGVPESLTWLTPAYLYIRSPLTILRNVVNIIPGVSPFQYGRLSIDPLLSLLSPGGHHSSDFFFKSLFGAQFSGFGLPATFMGTFYADAGWMGVFLGSMLMGLWTQSAFINLRRSPNQYRSIQYGWILQLALLAIYGSFMPYLSQWAIPIGLWMIWRISGRATSRTMSTSAPLSKSA